MTAPSVSSQQCASLPPCASDFQGEMLSELLRAGRGLGGTGRSTLPILQPQCWPWGQPPSTQCHQRGPQTLEQGASPGQAGRALGLWSMRSHHPGWGPRRSPESCEGEGEAVCWSCSRAPAYPGSSETSSWVGCEMQQRVPPTPVAREPDGRCIYSAEGCRGDQGGNSRGRENTASATGLKPQVWLSNKT